MERQFLRILFLVLLSTIPGMHPIAAPLKAPANLSIMTFNIENGGTQVSFKKVVEAIKRSNADVVGLQEPWGNTARLANELGWHYYNLAQHIISRYPLYETTANHQTYTLIEMSPSQFVAMANLHLLDEAYGPELVRAGKTAEEVMASERKLRMPAVLPVVNQLAELVKSGIPVFLVGDFNSGSHLDWTQTTVGKLPHHTLALKWPITQKLQQLGFIDSYHQTHPNTVKDPGYTWPAHRPIVKNTTDNFNPSAKDMSERIDFIFSSGSATALSSQIVGEVNNPSVALAIEPWPSDHRALVTRFAVTPVRLNKKTLISTRIKRERENNPHISVSKNSVKTGEPFSIRWDKAPGNRFDYIQITADSKAIKKTCIYTQATTQGSLLYTAQSRKNNGLDCFGKKWHKPLTPGLYTINLMQDDSRTLLASTQIRVLP